MAGRAVVTGATGMLAVATTRYLVGEGYDVIAVVRPGSSRIGNVPVSDHVTVAELDIRDIESLPGVLAASGIDGADLFFHFAWDGTHGSSRNDMDIQTENIRSSVSAVRAAAALDCETFLGAGSQAEFGRVEEGVKLSADLPCRPENGYGIGKYCAGMMTRIEAEKLGLKHIWVRILSTYGPLDGEHTLPMCAIRSMLAGEPTAFTKGEQMWDYLYCRDAARAFFLAATRGVPSSVYIIGSGEVRPLREYMEIIRDIIDPSIELGLGKIDYYPGQVMYLCADISALTRDTGFVPEYSFEQGMRETIEWFKGERK